MKPSILITYRIPEDALSILSNRFDLVMPPEGELAFPRAQWLPRLNEFDGVLLAAASLSAQDLRNPGRLRIISNYGNGYDNIDLDAATKNGIVVTNIPESTVESTAELAFGLMLTLSRRIGELDRRLRCGPTVQWGLMRNLSNNLMDKTLGILGMGRIGQAMARRARACGMSILYYNRSRLPEHQEQGARYVPLDELLARSDVLSVHCPLTEKTRGMLGDSQLRLMKPSALVINTARGGVFDEPALVRALTQGRLAGAGLDVFETEPNAIPPELLALDNVVLTPHVGTDTVEARWLMARQAAENILRFFEGKPIHVLNPEALNRKQ